MKKLTMLLLCLCTATTVFAQSSHSLFTVIDPGDGFVATSEYSLAGQKSELYKYEQLVQVASLKELILGGNPINLALPGKEETMLPLRISTIEGTKDDFLITGKVGDDPYSITTLRSSKGLVYGTIRYGNESFTITSKGKGSSVITQNITPGLDLHCPFASEVKGIEDPKESVESQEAFNKMICNERRLNILVMFTDAADQRVDDVRQVARNSVDLLNGMLHNSHLSLRASLVDVASFPEFVETDDIDDDLGRLGGFKGLDPMIEGADPLLTDIVEAEILRTGADMVLFLTGNSYGNVFGSADGLISADRLSIAAGPPSRIAIVQAEFSTEEFTFPHEVGHLFGCRHQAVGFTDCNGGTDLVEGRLFSYKGDAFTVGRLSTDTDGPEFAHAHVNSDCRNFFLSRHDAEVTVMFGNPTFDAPAVYHGARWDVDYLPLFSNLIGEDVGNAINADNRRQIRNTTNAVLGLGDCTPGFNVSATASSNEVVAGETVSLFGSSEDCDGTVIYEWEFSTNGFDFISAGSGQSINVTIPADQPSFSNVFIRLRGRCDDGDGNPLNDLTAVETYSLFVVGDDDCQGFDCLTAGEGEANKAAQSVDISFSKAIASPNPVTNILTFSVNEEAILGMEIYDNIGLLKLRKQHKGVGKSTKVDVSQLPRGTYTYRLNTEGETVVGKFIKL